MKKNFKVKADYTPTLAKRTHKLQLSCNSISHNILYYIINKPLMTDQEA